MPFSLSQIRRDLLRGDPIEWRSGSSNKLQTVQLSTPVQRRMFEYLLGLEPDRIAAPDESLFEPLMDAFRAENDPKADVKTGEETLASGPWILTRVESENFGGLNRWQGEPFVLELNEVHQVLEGYNGSGKTSLTSAILWALTGYRAQKQDAPSVEAGTREPAYDGEGNVIGSWPSLVAYPETVRELAQTATTSVKLHFVGPGDAEASVERTLIATQESDPEIFTNFDPRLLPATQLMEANLLMPARLPHAGFGKEKSEQLYAAIKMITGLDQLSDIGAGVGTLCRKNSKFLKYAKDAGIDVKELKFTSALERAGEHSKKAGFPLPEELKLGDQELDKKLDELTDKATKTAANTWETLSSLIVAELDLKQKTDRERLASAISSARHLLGDAPKSSQVVKCWRALSAGASEEGFEAVPSKLNEIEARLSDAIKWHERQQADEKLRLKALASRFFVAPEELYEAAKCPLCESDLESDRQQALTKELAELKQKAASAERKLKDACTDLRDDVRTVIPNAFDDTLVDLIAETPKAALHREMSERFVVHPDIAPVLTGFAEGVEIHLNSVLDELEDFEPLNAPDTAEDDDGVIQVRADIAAAMYVHGLAVWWQTRRKPFAEAWSAFLGKKSEEGDYPSDSVGGRLKAFEDALETAGPLDDLAEELEKAKAAAAEWDKIYEVQRDRETVAEALEPLKTLPGLVDHVSRGTLERLSERMGAIHAEMYVSDRLNYADTTIERKSVSLKGALAEDMIVDATMVANTSWLRGVLWAFVFALREECVRALRINAFPLMMFDDPQMTFDYTNERRWAGELARRCDAAVEPAERVQLLLATHCRRFFTALKTQKVPGAFGKLMRPNGAKSSATVLDGMLLDRLRARAEHTNDEDDMVRFIIQVRVYCEELLRVMLRGQAPEISGDDLPKLVERLGALHNQGQQPFSQAPFKRVLNAFDWSDPTIRLIQKTHHEDDATVGKADFESVCDYWKKRIRDPIDHAFQVAVDHAHHFGPPQLFTWADSVVELPMVKSEALKQTALLRTGIAAAASTDGRVGDGFVSVTEEKAASDSPVKFHNHSAFVLTKPNLSPVLEPGDTLIVRNYGEPNPKNLVVAAYGDALLARRSNDAEGAEDLTILTGQARNPYELPDPITAPKHKLVSRKIIGTLFTGDPDLSTNNLRDEVRPIEDGANLTSFLSNTFLLSVSGASMEPIALDGQMLIVAPVQSNAESMKSMDGQLVIASTDSGGAYFKRLRVKGDFAILEAVNSNYGSGTELVSIAPRPGFDHLKQLYAVRGVLFENP